MYATDQAWHYQISAHGANRFSVQAFGPDGKKLDEAIVKDINGWRWPGESRQFETVREAAAVCFAEFANLPMASGYWIDIENEFCSKV